MERPCSSKSKIGGRKVIRSQSREIIANVYDYMNQEAKDGKIMNLTQVQARVCKATGISRSTIQRILKERENNLAENKCFNTPHKKRPRRKSKTELDDFDKCVIRRTINKFHLTEGERPTLRSLLRTLKTKIDFKGSKWALRKVIRNLGFRWCKTKNNRKLLIEKNDIREMRLNYLRSVEKYRRQGLHR